MSPESRIRSFRRLNIVRILFIPAAGQNRGGKIREGVEIIGIIGVHEVGINMAPFPEQI
jgi:hypothetical protein